MTVRIDNETRDKLIRIAEKYSLSVRIIEEQDFEFQEIAIKDQKIVGVRSFIDRNDFDRLFEQLSQEFEISHDQDMFVFNLFHGIGHFELDLWKGDHKDILVGRLENLKNDVKVNEWAFEKFEEWKSKFT